MDANMKKILPISLVALLLISTAGCGLSLPWAGRSAGRESYQQLRATHFDPYPDMSAGPAVLGGRPQQFQVQRSEATRSQWDMDARRQ
jgi:hypothetical protein